MANKSNWKGWEKFVAAIFGWKRNILSGRNNRHDDGSPTIGDVRVPPEYRNLNIECKVRRKFAIVKMFKDISGEAPDKTTLLFVHEARQLNEESLVVMDVATFRKFWDAAKDKFSQKDKKEVIDDPLGLLGGDTEAEIPQERNPRRKRTTDPKGPQKDARAARKRTTNPGF